MSNQISVASPFTHQHTATKAAGVITLYFLLIGLTSRFPVQFVGKISASEILAILFVLSQFVFGKLPNLKPLFGFLVAGLAVLLAIIASDNYHKVPWLTTAKSMANFGFVLSNLVALYWGFQKSPRVIVGYVTGILLANCVRPWTDADLVRLSTDYLQTFVLPFIVSAAFLATILFFHKRRILSAGLVTIAAVAALFCDGRMAFLAVSCGGGLYLFRDDLRGSFQRIRSRFKLRHIFAVTICGYAVFILLVETAEKGMLGPERKTQVAKMENRYNPFEYVIKNGRGGLAAGYVAICEKPILGHGSKADGKGIVKVVSDRYGIKFSYSEMEKYGWIIPSHSIVLGSWVDCGFVGGFFWLFALQYMVRNGLLRTEPPSRLQAWFFFATLSACLAIVFSPLSYVARQSVPAIIAIIMCSPPIAGSNRPVNMQPRLGR